MLDYHLAFKCSIKSLAQFCTGIRETSFTLWMPPLPSRNTEKFHLEGWSKHNVRLILHNRWTKFAQSWMTKIHTCIQKLIKSDATEPFDVSELDIDRLTDFVTGSKHSVGLPVSNSCHWVNCTHVQISWLRAKIDSASHSVISPFSHISMVWKHFGFEKDNSEKLVKGAWATCKLCMQKIAHGSGTTNLKNHLRTNIVPHTMSFSRVTCQRLKVH